MDWSSRFSGEDSFFRFKENTKVSQKSTDTQLRVNKGMKIAVARWIKLPNIVVPLGVPPTTITVQADASLKGFGFLINQKSYHVTFDLSMETYSINVLELMAIWMATLKIQEKNQALKIMTDNSAALAAIKRAHSQTYHLVEMIWKRAATMNCTGLSW